MTTDHNDIKTKNRRVVMGVIMAVIVMIGLSFAAVPLYDLFCRVTGFGGTTQFAETVPDRILDRSIKIAFDANTARDMPWRFAPEQRALQIRLGEKKLTAYRAENLSGQDITGTAVYNVTPNKAGKYFHKIECFCFAEQTLTAGQAVSMPVVFFIDPAMNEDRDMDDVTTITLSYSFFRKDSSALDNALEDFYNQPSAKIDIKADISQ